MAEISIGFRPVELQLLELAEPWDILGNISHKVLL